MSETWYRIAFADEQDVHLATAPGAHLGEAIAVATSRLGRNRVWPIAAATAPPDEVPLGESVGKGVLVARGAAPAGLDRFQFPSGVLPALELPGARDPAAARPRILAGWRSWRVADTGGGGQVGDTSAVQVADTLAGAQVADTAAGVQVADTAARVQVADTFVFEAVVPGDEARERFLDVIERFPTADNIEVRVAPQEDGGTITEVWLTPRLRDVRRAIRFLDDFDADLLGNGHVDIAVYVRAPRSTWRLTQHKTLIFLTEDRDMLERVRDWTTTGLEQRAQLITVAEHPHLHYRPADSNPRVRLLSRLKKAGLRLVDQLSDQP